jgi:hypothetical protein
MAVAFAVLIGIVVVVWGIWRMRRLSRQAMTPAETIVTDNHVQQMGEQT